MTHEFISRRAFLKTSVATGSTIMLGSITGTASALVAQAGGMHEETVRIVAPNEATVLPGFLAAKLQWEYAAREAPYGITLTVTPRDDQQHPVVHVALPGDVTIYPMPLVPEQTYTWELQPTDAQGRPTVVATRGTFTAGPVRLVENAPISEVFNHPRKGAHIWGFNLIKPVAETEPLSPWYDITRYTMGPPPVLADIKDQLPQPVLDGHADALAAYWYCWETLLWVWLNAPPSLDHQAVANVYTYPTWAGFGDGAANDAPTVTHYMRYGHQAYPFITWLDNLYARQHENGFYCGHADPDNLEFYDFMPAAEGFLIGWSELDYYQVSGDLQRLRRVFMPLVKNYEWFMTYMRHNPDGHYRVVAFGWEIDTAFGMTTARAAETLALARIATLVGRPDLARFFTAEYRRVGALVNQQFWDAEHQLYNDRCDPNHFLQMYRDPKLAGKFVTEVRPGVVNKNWSSFFPLFAEIVPPERVQATVRLLRDPKRGFGYPNGLGTYSVDSNSANTIIGNYGNSQIFPPPHFWAQQGFKLAGERAVAQDLAERYWKAIVAAYTKDKTLNEALDSNEIAQHGQPEFVGWSGLGPIAILIEDILGFDVNVPRNTIVWHLRRTERHGLQHLKIGSFYVDLLCAERATATAPSHLTVTSGGAFTLQTVVGEKVVRHRIQSGTTTLMVRS